MGVDYVGLIKYKVIERCEGKVYFIFYVCSLIRVLYFDLVRILESSEFFLSLKGFIVWCGRLNIIYLDNGSIFIGVVVWIK